MEWNLTRFGAGTSINEPLRTQLERIYEASFPPEEREDTRHVFDVSPDREMFVARDPDARSALGFASVIHATNRVALLDYLAVSADARSGGIGGCLLDAVLEGLSQGATEMVFMELERPESASEPELAARRVRFYERHGCEPVEWVPDYWMPDLAIPGRRIPMLLYWKLFAAASASPNPEAFHALYRRAYPGVSVDEFPRVTSW